MRRLRRLLVIVLSVAAVAWIGAIGTLLLNRTELIYPFATRFDAARPVGLPDARLLRFATDGGEVVAWVTDPAPGQLGILHFTGNVGFLPNAARRMRVYADAGYGIAILAYRGAGGHPGEPSEEALTADALALYDRLRQEPGWQDPPVAHGTSLGAAVAVQVAARREVRGLVLVAPFARLCETAEHHYPLIPACAVLPDNRWESAAAIAGIEAPLLLLHGDADEVIPVAHGRALFAAAVEPKQLIVYEGGGHDDLGRFGSRSDTMAWLERLAP
ncbi:MAG: alpha/beta hydrolase [Pseudomonadota bacterium]